MSIRMRLLLSYAAMLIIPLILIMLTALLLIGAFRGDVQSIHQMYGQKAADLADHPNEQLIREIKRTTERNPSLLADVNYVNDLNQELSAWHSGLIVRENGTLTYVSSMFNDEEIISRLPAFERNGNHEEAKLKRTGAQSISVIQFDYLTSSHSNATVYILTTINPIVNFARKFLPTLILCILIILVLTHTLLTFFVSRSIIAPLRILKQAARRIKEGNLEESVKVSGKDEIGALGIAFEEMRLQLRESIQKQLQYEENRKDLISSISHDLKTPLTAIQGYVAGLQDGVADTPVKWERYMSTIAAKTEQMDRLIDELFLYSKLDLNRLPFNFEIIDISAFVEDCVVELQFDLEKKGYRFEAENRLPQGTKVSVDRDKLMRVITNIIENCVKYMDKEQKKIRFEAWNEQHTVMLGIADNGPGIREEDLLYIFDRFYRAEQSRNAGTGGSGLGLAIAKQLVQGHGGTIEAQSGEGEGTFIIIQLPVISNRNGEAHENDSNH